ncbi:MAG: hypothetical protein IKM81_07720 [Fibrobacter sp.]|nr:hypothetical protein [Fibrobacter sp.]
MALDTVHQVFDIVGNIAAMVGLIGAYLAYRQWKEQKSKRQVEYLRDFSCSIMGNPDMAAFVYMIERDKSIGYVNGEFKSQKNEQVVDFALCCLSNYVALRNSKLISEDEFRFAKYVLKHTLENPEVKEYLKFLDGIVKDDRDAHPYKQLLEEAEK